MATQAASNIETIDMEELRKMLDMEELRKPARKNSTRSSSSLRSARQDSPSSTAQHRRCSSSMSTEFIDVAAAKEKAKTSHKFQRNGWKVSWRWSRMRKDMRKQKAISLVGRKSFRENDHKPTSKANCSQEQTNYEESTKEKLRSYSKKECCSSASLNQKYQPKVFEDIAGHEITIKAISNAAKQKKVSHLYLFHGPSGTGKMSTARIFSMALNCESTAQTKPCWSCRGCSRSLYIMELCSGSRSTGFQRISTLLQSTSFTQAVPGFKVFIIEECHLLTAEAWDELLDAAQGKYGFGVIFVLITGDANMVPGTVSSRCQKFHFPKLKDSDITPKLVRIAFQEGIGIEREALRLVTAKAEGSLREAENILDQLTLLGPRICTSMVQQIVGLVSESKLTDLLVAAISGDVNKTIKLTKEQIASGIEPQTLVSQLASLVTEIISNAAVSAPDYSSLAGSSRDKNLLKSASQDLQLSNTHSEQLCCALKLLVDMEKQSSIDQNALVFATLLQIASLDVPDRTSLEDMAENSGNKSNTESVEMHHSRLFDSGSHSSRHSISKTSEHQNIDRINLNIACKSTEETNRCRGKAVEREPNMGEVEEIWLNILQRMRHGHMKEFLCHKVKLASLTVSKDNAIVHLIFKKPEDKLAAQISEESISKALKKAIGYPVTVNMSLQPVDVGILEENAVSRDKSPLAEYAHSRQHQKTLVLPECVHNPNLQGRMHCRTHHRFSPQSESKSLRTKDLKHSTVRSEGRDRCIAEDKEIITAWPQQMIHLAGFLTEENQLDASEDPRTRYSARDQSALDTTHNRRNKMPKHRWVSLSSIQQSDASVERYSQDILFENENLEKDGRSRKHTKLHRSLSKACEDNHARGNAKTIGLYRSWSCKDMLCQRKTKVTNHAS